MAFATVAGTAGPHTGRATRLAGCDSKGCATKVLQCSLVGIDKSTDLVCVGTRPGVLVCTATGLIPRVAVALDVADASATMCHSHQC